MARIYKNPNYSKDSRTKSKFKAEVSFTNPNTGHRKRFTGTFVTRKEAVIWASGLEAEKKQGTNYDKSSMLTWQFFWLWTKMYRKQRVSISTLSNYKNTMNKLRKYLPNVVVSKLTRPLLQSFFDCLDLSYETKRKILGQLKSCLTDAVLDGVISRNPAKRIQINADKSRTKSEQDKFLSDTDFQKVRESLADSKYSFDQSKDMALMVVAYTGCRIGEVLDLQWNDINYDNSTITIDSSWDRIARKSKAPKTVNSNRVVPMNDTLSKKLKEWGHIVKKHLIETGMSGQVTHLFLDKEFHVLNETTVNSRFKAIQRNLGITNTISQHGLRHNVASRLLNNDVPVEYVSAYLGHSNISITQKYYDHLLPEKKAVEDEKVLALLG